jgi:hypothetical protein
VVAPGRTANGYPSDVPTRPLGQMAGRKSFSCRPAAPARCSGSVLLSQRTVLRFRRRPGARKAPLLRAGQSVVQELEMRPESPSLASDMQNVAPSWRCYRGEMASVGPCADE